jgi:hypothetical protein
MAVTVIPETSEKVARIPRGLFNYKYHGTWNLDASDNKIPHPAVESTCALEWIGGGSDVDRFAT